MKPDITLQEVPCLTVELWNGLSELLVSVVKDGASVGFMAPLSRDEAKAYWQGVLLPGVHLWTAQRNGQVVGTVQLQLAMKPNGSHRAEIAKLMVQPDCRRSGIAKSLMLQAEERARQLSRSLLVLDTREGDPSNDLYRSLGYIEAGRIPRYARSSDGKLDGTVLYYKEVEELPL